MKNMLTRSAKTLLVVLAVVAGVGMGNPAHAYDHGRGGDRGWDHHAAEAHRWHHAHPAYYPGYVEAPPVVYAPPPSGLNLILPINIH